ncbi:MAG TPA: SMP-30/gluconolactonase/LRE family protein [Nitrospira sp.]|nr:SMP-30/gluconolactonase/LRE family protein [Nitrospira sp.]
MSTPIDNRGSKHLVWWVTPLTLIVVYLALWPTGVDPVAWNAPRDSGYAGVYQINQRLSGLTHLRLAPGQDGPEHITVHQEALYTGLSNGDVIRMSLDGQFQSVVMNTGGRPLGIDFDQHGRMLIADAFKGLIRVTQQGREVQGTIILNRVDNPVSADPVRYANAVKVAPDGLIWLTDASRHFGAKTFGGTFNASLLDLLEHSCTGRVIAMDPETLTSRVAIAGLCFPNGIAFTFEGQSLYLSETGQYRILRIDLRRLLSEYGNDKDRRTPSVDELIAHGVAMVLIENLPGYPDNLMQGQQGRIWVGLTRPRSRLIDELASHPTLRSVVLRVPRFLWPRAKTYGHVFAFDEHGKIVDDLQDPSGSYPDTAAATEIDGILYIHSLHAPSIGMMTYHGPSDHPESKYSRSDVR